MINVKFLTGSKDGIDNQITANRIDAGDVILTSDTDELIFINPESEKRIIKSKTQQAHTLNGTDLGALKDGAVIEAGTDIDELLRLITTKVIPATYEEPTVKIVVGGDVEHEIGSSVSAKLHSQFIQNDAGALTAHNILKNGEIIYEGQTASLIESLDNFIITEEAVSFESQASYGAGEIKNNNLNEASPEGAIAAGVVTSKPIVFKGYRNLFYGTGIGELPELNSENIRALKPQLNPVNGIDFSVSIEEGEQYVIFAYPSTLEDVKQITYVQMNDTEMASSFTKTLVQVEGADGYQPIEYKVYTYKTDIPVISKVTFKVEIGG
jgi:hypothetical protein